MTDGKSNDTRAKKFFDDIWSQDDFWKFETSEYEKKRFEAIFAMINNRRYNRILEIGCGTGTFTRILSSIANEVVALDISNKAVNQAKIASVGFGNIDYRAANIMELNLTEEGKWDLVIMSEVIFYLGWLYTFFQIGWLSAQLLNSLNKDGRLVLANTVGRDDDFSYEMILHLPWHIHSYRDLFCNVGYKLEDELIFRGVKDEYELNVLISLFKSSNKSVA